MVEKIGNGSALAREALRAAQRVVSERSPAGDALGRVDERTTPLAGNTASTARPVDFTSALESGLREVDQRVQAAESVPADLLAGKIDDFHEIAVQLKSAEISFRFAMEIRNKLVDAYREIMRMNV